MAMGTSTTLDDDISGFVKQQGRVNSKAAHRLINKRLRRRVSSDRFIPARKPSRIPTFSSEYVPDFDPLKIKQFLDKEDVEHFLRVSAQ